MQKLALCFFLASAALATKVDIVWRHDKDTSETALTVFHATKGTKLADTCGSVLSAAHPIDFSGLNVDGAGSFFVGNKSYNVHSNPEISGGPQCSRVYNDGLAFVDCEEVEWDSAPIVSLNETIASCFHENKTVAAFQTLASRAISSHRALTRREIPSQEEPRSAPMDRAMRPKRHERGVINSRVDKRTENCDKYSSDVYLDGDGSPGSIYMHTQLSENINCASADSCSVGESDSVSYTIGWSVSSGAELADWISGGFDVSKSWTTGNTYSCNAGKGETVCIWYNTAHTTYAVIEKNVICYEPIQYTHDRIQSPNKNNEGGGYYCVIGTCRSKGEFYWDNK